MATLSAIDLSFSYDPSQTILSNLNFEIKPGQIMGLAGANGSGKSTLINILAGLLKPESGQITLGQHTGHKAWETLRGSSALLPQNVDHWLLGETGAEDLALGLDKSDPETNKLLNNLIHSWQLADFIERPVEILSLGQKKKLALAAALAKNPLAVFLDEPLAGLDWPGVQSMLKALAQLKKTGVITIIVTHEPGLTANLVDNWLLLKPGGEYLFGPDLAASFNDFGVRPL